MDPKTDNKIDKLRLCSSILTAFLLWGFGVLSAHFWEWLIRVREIEVVVWGVVYLWVLYKVIMNFETCYQWVIKKTGK